MNRIMICGDVFAACTEKGDVIAIVRKTYSDTQWGVFHIVPCKGGNPNCVSLESALDWARELEPE